MKSPCQEDLEGVDVVEDVDVAEGLGVEEGLNVAGGGRGEDEVENLGESDHEGDHVTQCCQTEQKQLAEKAREERQENMKERLSMLGADELREVVLNIYERNPSHLLDVLGSHPNGRGEGYHPQPGPNVPTWCSCSHCREMPSEQERLCCGETPENCHSRLRDFDTIVLDELVLEVARRYRNDVLAQPEDNDHNRANRCAAYRQYFLWTHGHLGAGNRRVIASCCVWKIRDKYPDPFGQYIGFIGGRLG